MQQPSSQHRWRFFRIGGCDQVRIDSVADLRHLGELDQKLWAVLACPTAGLECDARTLELIDSDGDGSIRVPELRAAVAWALQALHTPELLLQPGGDLPLAALRRDTPEGAAWLAAAQQVLARRGRAAADALQVDDFADLASLFPADQINGDGIVPLALVTDPAAQALWAHVVATQEPVLDRSGAPGVSASTLAAFLAAAQQVQDWHAQAASQAAAGLWAWGAETGQALAAFDAVADKVQDYYTRCRLAAFDERATAALNPAIERYTHLAPQALSDTHAEVDALPLAQVAPGAALPLGPSVNPAWQARVAQLQQWVVEPVLGPRQALTQDEWDALAQRLLAYRAWLAQRPATPVADVPAAALSAALQPPAVAALHHLIEQDQACDANAQAVHALERLVRYRRDVLTVLRNFVNLNDFYAQQPPAMFQAGTLYIDQRSCNLCLRVADMDRHAALAALSGTFLLYCECTRPDEAPLTIVAAMTGGDVDDMLVPGRNGVFYDRAGRDWRAQVVKVVEAPVSVRQAFWSPYKRIARFMGEQMQRFAAARDQNVQDQAGAQVAAAPAAPAAFDIAKFAGIFAAIGLALGALGTAVVALVGGFMGLTWWQMPLVLLGVLLLISGPSMLLAWFKLRQRNVGPLLDANGWAVNIRARINLPFGASLTRLAQLPSGAERSLSDPYAEKSHAWLWWGALAVLLGALGWAWRQGWV